VSSGSPQRDRDRESRERSARRAAASSSGRSPTSRGSRPAARRRSVHWLVAVLIGVVALAGGLLAGYASRGDSPPAELITPALTLGSTARNMYPYDPPKE